MSVSRGDVVLLDFPFPSGRGAKRRPALVVQNDTDNARLLNTIVAQITSVTHRAHEPTQVFIDLATEEGQQSGLLHDSVVNCVNLYTVEQSCILRHLGSLPDALMQQVDDALEAALDLP